MPYQPTWNSPYATASAYQMQQLTPTVQYPMQWQQPTNGVEKVSGKDSLWQLPMAPNSTSKPYFDYNGKQFYVVSTDAAAAKTIETFDYFRHVDEQTATDGGEYVSRQEFEQFVSRTSAALEALNGIHGPVPSGAASNTAAEGAVSGK